MPCTESKEKMKQPVETLLLGSYVNTMLFFFFKHYAFKEATGLKEVDFSQSRSQSSSALLSNSISSEVWR